MKLFHKGKDGGPESTVTGYWLFEIKNFFSVALLKFENGSRDAFHSHAFNCLSWVLGGHLREEHLSGETQDYKPGIWPVVTRRRTFHRVFSHGTTWVFTIRGPWKKRWEEYNPITKQFTTLKNGRIVVTSGIN